MVVVVVMISAARVTPRAERRNRMAKRRLRVTLAGSLTVVALALAACGTDSGGGGGASATVQIWEGYSLVLTEAETLAIRSRPHLGPAPAARQRAPWKTRPAGPSPSPSR